MRPTWSFLRAGLAGVAALALLTACGGGSSTSASSSSSAGTTSSSAATTTSAGPTGADAVFCSQVGQLVTQLTAAQAAAPEQTPALLQQLLTAFGSVTPPAAVQADWQTLGAGLRQLQTAVAGLDVTSPQGQQQLAQLKQQALAAAAPAQGNISAWVLGHCGASSASSAGSSSAAATTS
jgi:hypothetical protein